MRKGVCNRLQLSASLCGVRPDVLLQFAAFDCSQLKILKPDIRTVSKRTTSRRWQRKTSIAARRCQLDSSRWPRETRGCLIRQDLRRRLHVTKTIQVPPCERQRDNCRGIERVGNETVGGRHPLVAASPFQRRQESRHEKCGKESVFGDDCQPLRLRLASVTALSATVVHAQPWSFNQRSQAGAESLDWVHGIFVRCVDDVVSSIGIRLRLGVDGPRPD